MTVSSQKKRKADTFGEPPAGIPCTGADPRCHYPKCDCGLEIPPPPAIFGEVPAHG